MLPIGESDMFKNMFKKTYTMIDTHRKARMRMSRTFRRASGRSATSAASRSMWKMCAIICMSVRSAADISACMHTAVSRCCWMRAVLKSGIRRWSFPIRWISRAMRRRFRQPRRRPDSGSYRNRQGNHQRL